MKRMRIAVGTFEVSGFVHTLGDAFERLGHEVTTAVRVADDHFEEGYHLDLLEPERAPTFHELRARLLDPRARPRVPGPRASALDRLHWLVQHHDLFVFVYGSLVPDRRGHAASMGLGRDFELLRRLGKRIVVCFVGPEARHPSAYDQQLALLGSPARPLGNVVGSWSRVPVAHPLVNVRRAELHADVVLSQPNQAGLALRPYTHLFAPVDLRRFRSHIPGRERPVVLHTPSYQSVKGTGEILAALERVHRSGVDFEIRMLQRISNAEVLREMRRADVVIDQLHLPLHGRLGVEAMASGCAVATCNDERLEAYPRHRPVWHIDVGNLERRLRRLLRDRDLRIRLAEEGVAYARKNHGHVNVARRVLECLEPAGYRTEHHPDFFARHYRLPEGERLPAAARRATAAVARRYGLPRGVSEADLRTRGLI